jgi:glycosyltransferase involved in cell wall biosynthesis
MYVLVTHIPIYKAGDQRLVSGSWYPDVALARDWFSPHFGQLVLVGPSLPAEQAPGDAMVIGAGDDIRTVASFDARVKTRSFFTQARRQLMADLAPLMRDARVVHAGVDSALRPIQLTGLRMAARAGKTSVLIGPDMDPTEVMRAQRQLRLGLKQRMFQRLHRLTFERAMHKEAGRASVSMLKQGLVYDSYARFAKNPKAFCHTMHRTEDVVAEPVLEQRLARMAAARQLRLVYFGRLVARKGLVDAIHVIALLRRQGLDVSYDIFGDGEQRDELQRLAAQLGLESHVRCHGHVPYGPELFRSLQGFDALLFSPTEEDTPRMVYDAMACGLPLLTSDIPFLRTRAEHDGVSVVFRVGDREGAARCIAELHGDRGRLRALSRKARLAGLNHTVEHWYGLRTQWTREAAAANAAR